MMTGMVNTAAYHMFTLIRDDADMGADMNMVNTPKISMIPDPLTTAAHDDGLRDDMPRRPRIAMNSMAISKKYISALILRSPNPVS